MKRALPLAMVVLTGCLSAGDPLYGKLDSTPPRIAAISPPMGGDAGVVYLTPSQFIVLTFSEPMELDSLRAGIVVRNRDRKEQPLTIQVDPDQLRPITAKDPDVEFKVQISSAEPSGFATGAYQLILRTLLIDQQGNGLDGEFLGAFYVQF
ncbi:MAG: hypothetical protein H6Q89_315 [Myxococcaceae bacterium]|nr:hypothetical protein [Myxococcaceae bacterium]